MMKSLAGLAVLTLCASLVIASEPIPFDSPRWQIAAEENRIEQYKGKTSSDRLRLFVNDRLLYTGNNGYRTRDYRYLGTIGHFDAVTVPLHKGRNELGFAVSESFGGWGLQAAFDDTDGLTIVE